MSTDDHPATTATDLTAPTLDDMARTMGDAIIRLANHGAQPRAIVEVLS